jgi:formylglycine-generating enzyme required for sulfatase activity
LEDHPIVNVTWDEAQAYCQWVGGSLPTEAQWERAARGTDERKFPWGNVYESRRVWGSRAQVRDAGKTTSVGHYGISAASCTDMAGNVWQWCFDYYDADYWWRRAREKPFDPVNMTVNSREMHVVKGGSWWDVDPNLFRSALRAGRVASARYNHFGFRCVMPRN